VSVHNELNSPQSRKAAKPQSRKAAKPQSRKAAKNVKCLIVLIKEFLCVFAVKSAFMDGHPL